MSNQEPEHHRAERLAARAATYTTNVARLRALIGDGDDTEETEA